MPANESGAYRPDPEDVYVSAPPLADEWAWLTERLAEDIRGAGTPADRIDLLRWAALTDRESVAQEEEEHTAFRGVHDEAALAAAQATSAAWGTFAEAANALMVHDQAHGTYSGPCTRDQLELGWEGDRAYVRQEYKAWRSCTDV